MKKDDDVKRHPTEKITTSTDRSDESDSLGILLMLLLGIIAYGRVIFFGGGSNVPHAYSLSTIRFAIALALGLQVITSTLI